MKGLALARGGNVEWMWDVSVGRYTRREAAKGRVFGLEKIVMME